MEELISITKAIHQERYPEARVIFLAGSLVRGEGTKTSDLDLVVVFEKLPNAYRESFYFDGWPVEAFVNDPETLNYFFTEYDKGRCIPSLPRMVSEGIEVPVDTDLSNQLKRLANSVLDRGPPPWNESEIDNSRYAITTIVDDLRAPRSRTELTASAAALYLMLANHFLRARGTWSAQDKMIPRALEHMDKSVADEFTQSFDDAFQNGKPAKLIALTERVLSPQGGSLFEGYTKQAPPEWRREIKDSDI